MSRTNTKCSRADTAPQKTADSSTVASWMAGIRVAFGIVWAINAYLKWQPAFLNHILDLVMRAENGQPTLIKEWIAAWANILRTQPHMFSYLLAIAETALAVGLLIGAFTNALCVMGGLLSLSIWSTAEGFGGPYHPGSTDVGASIIYVLVFASIIAGAGGSRIGVDMKLRPWLAKSRFPSLARLSSRRLAFS